MPSSRSSLVSLIVLAILAVAPTAAAGGELDRSFGGDGRVVRDGLSGADELAVDARGRTIALGDRPGTNRRRSVLVATRFLPSGRIDHDFGRDGSVSVDASGAQDYAAGLAIGPGGRITLAADTGSSNRYDICDGGESWSVEVFRLLPSGRPDRSFGDRGSELLRDDPGLVFESPTALAVGPDGSVALSGYGYVAGEACEPVGVAVRLDGDGEPASEFGGDGTVRVGELNHAFDAALDSEGRLLIGAEPRSGGFGVIRLLADGSVDETYGQAGLAKVAGTRARDMEPLAEGRMAVAGAAGRDSVVAVFDAGGELDPELAGDGTVQTPFADAPEVVRRERGFLAAGTVAGRGSGADFGAVAFGADGVRDDSFGRDGIVEVDLADGADDVVASAASAPGARTLIGGQVEGAGAADALGLVRLRR